MESIKGLDKLTRDLRQLRDVGCKKAARAGLAAASTQFLKAIRQGVNGVDTSSQMKRAARQSLGRRIAANANEFFAKTGLGVGKRSKKAREAAKERHMRGQGGSHEVKGVGISAANIHWATLGTKERYTKKTGKYTGKMPAIFEGVIPKAVAGSIQTAMSAARARVGVVITREMSKKG